MLVHGAAWVEHLREGSLTYREEAALELPYSASMTRAFWLAAGGTILAARLALEDGVGFHIGGGWHHGAYADHGEGILRHQRHRGGDSPDAERRPDRARHGHRRRRPPRQRHGGDLRRRCVRLHARPFIEYANYPSNQAALESRHRSAGRRRHDEEYLRRLTAGCRQALARVLAGAGDLRRGRRSVSPRINSADWI